MSEVRVNLDKAAAGDRVERAMAEAVAREVQAGNLVFRGYDRGLAVYGKKPMKVGHG